MIYKFLVIFGCSCLIIAGIIAAIKLNNWKFGLAEIFVGLANLIFMLNLK